VRILAHVHTYDEVVDETIEAILKQSYPVNEILVVDNASTKPILQDSRQDVTKIRNSKNVGPGGALVTGFRYALENGYDWMWIFDGDSKPRSDALEKLVELYKSLEPEDQARVGALSCSQVLEPSELLFQGRRLTPSGPRLPDSDGACSYHECDSSLWSGSLFRLNAVREVGLPRCGTTGYWEDLSFDQGDVEFYHRITRAGYRVLVHRSSLVNHLVGQSKEVRFLGRNFLSTNHRPDRRYLYFRNLVYFWFHLYPQKNLPGLSVWFVCRLIVTVSSILLFESQPASKTWACVRGTWDGLRKNIERKYPT
jgi:rhamnosyltransferase